MWTVATPTSKPASRATRSDSPVIAAVAAFIYLEFRGALSESSFQRLGQIPQFALGLFALADIARNDDMNDLSIHWHGRGRNFDRNVGAIEPTDDPLKRMSSPPLDLFNNLPRFFDAALAIGLHAWRKFLGALWQNLIFILGANKPDRRLIAVQQFCVARIDQTNGVGASLKEAFKHSTYCA